MKTIPNQPFFEEIEQIISEGNTVELKVKGGSMRPYLRNEKDIVVISPFQQDDLKCGEIVLFRYHKNHLLHRIVKKREDGMLVIQGDGVCNRYEKVSQSDVVGIVRCIIRPNGKRIATNRFSFGIYWLYWNFLRPVRPYLLFLYDRIIRHNHSKKSKQIQYISL